MCCISWIHLNVTTPIDGRRDQPGRPRRARGCGGQLCARHDGRAAQPARPQLGEGGDQVHQCLRPL